MYPRFRRVVRASLLALWPLLLLSIAQAQGAKIKINTPDAPIADADTDHIQERAEWFMRGRVVPGKSAAELRHRAYQTKMQARAARRAAARIATPDSQAPSSAGWTPLGPVPLTSDASGGIQDYHQVSGRATAVAIDPADPSGNTVYIGGAQGGVWKSTNAATSIANNVTWTAVTDDQATLSIGSIVIQPGNTDPAKSVVLVGTGEADNSGDSYYGLGMLRSADGGKSWALIPTANGGSLSFSGLGATRMAFSTASTSTVVTAMAATAEGVVDNALNANIQRGLYTSTDAGQNWTYTSPFSGVSEITSATSVVYNAVAGQFFAAVRYHGFYSSPDGLTWTRLTTQPGAPGVLSTTACPVNYVTSCPMYRGEITVVPGRNEMYVWFVSLGSNNSTADQGIWQSKDGGATWTAISDSGIINCVDFEGCGIAQAFYDMDLLAVPNGGSATDLYAGTINLYKCSINTGNPACSNSPFINLTHVYGCNPILAALAHVHPDQHAMAYTIPSGSTSDLMYFANDGGIYRALDGYSGLTTGSCSGSNQFDDLNENLGSMTQFVSFTQHPSDPNTILGGTQDNGSPATVSATTSPSWGNVLGGDGGYNAIDPNTGNWFASNPDFGGNGLAILECSSGTNCDNNLFNAVVTSNNLAGDNGAFYFPYILDPQSTSSLLVGTCRVWRGPRSGGAFSALSLNFETFGAGVCAGNEVNTVRAFAAGGPTDANGSKVIYATTSGLGPNYPTAPAGGHVWVTTSAAPVSGLSSTFTDTTSNGPGGSSINPSRFPVSSVAIDTSDPTANTAYVTVMGFSGGAGHVWQTTNAGASWIDFTGTGTNALPDSPVNAVVVDPGAHVVYVGTDVGVFQSFTSAAAWTEVGPVPNPQGGNAGFLPNVAVTALALFDSGGKKLLRASTYGRGVWQFDLLAAPDFQIAVSNTPLTAFAGSNATFNGTLTAVNGYNNSVALSCTAGSSNPPSPCTPSPVSLTPTSAGAAFLVTPATSTVGDYDFNVQGAGSDTNNTTHLAAVTLHVVAYSMTPPSPSTVTEPRGTTSPPVSFQLTAQGSFSQGVTLSCGFSPSISGATCAFTPGAVVTLASGSPVDMTATVTVPAGTATGNYTVTLQAATPGAPAPLTASFTVTVTNNPDFVFSEATPFPNVKEGSMGTSGPITISSQDGFAGTVTLSCSNSFGANSCSISPTTVSTFPATATLVINGTTFSAGSYSIAVQGVSGSTTHSFGVSFNVGKYFLQGPLTLSAVPGAQVQVNLTLTSSYFYSGQINATCDASQLQGAQCTLSPANPITLNAVGVVPVTASINIPNNAPPGTYNINFNSQDVTGAPSISFDMALTVSQDFTIGSLTPATQTVKAGQSASYNFSVLPVGTSFDSAVSLSCSGGPAISLCTFTPGPVTPGSSAAAVVLKISTTASTAGLLPAVPGGTAVFYALWLALPGLALVATSKRWKKVGKVRLPASLLALFVLALLLPSCGGGGTNGSSSSGGGGQGQGTQPGSYTITVTGTSGTLIHHSTVMLVVTPPGASGISGAWEFAAQSATSSGSTTLIEADLSANGAQTSASGPSQVQTATYTGGLWYVNGYCSSPSPGQNSISGTVSGSSVSLTFNEGGNVFTGQGILSGSTISGTYSGTNPGCSDSGTFTATQVPNLAGTFSGTLSFPNGSDQVTATLTESSNYSLTFQTTLTGTDNGNFTFSGSAVANVAFVSGSINGNTFSLFGYFDSSGTYTGTPNSMAVFDYNTLKYEGLLIKQ